MIIQSLSGVGESLAREMDEDSDFSMNSRRVRLEALAGYCRTALRLLAAGAIQTAGKKPKIVRAPANIATLTTIMPDLQGVIEDRWLEAQKCQHAGAYLAAVIMMGSILEALLLARATMSREEAYRSSAATQTQLEKWSLDRLVNVSAERGWIKSDRKSFGHALRHSRNVVHPWNHVASKANFDKSTCTLCWQTLRASVDDLIASVSP